jgi:hypothetical protein
LIGWATSKGVEETYLGTTSKYLAAHRFYKKNSFIEIDKSILPKEFPVMKVDTKFFKLSL